MKFLLAICAAAALCTPALADQVLPLAPFHAVKATDGAHVTIRHGNAQLVRIVQGSTAVSRLDVNDGTLTIVTCTGWHCPQHYRLEVEIVTPQVTALNAEDGALIEAQGSFPGQPDLSASADDGGKLDARAIAAAHVRAHANDGGDLLVHADGTLAAHAEDGGIIHYAGKATVTELTAEDGGAVRKDD